MEKLNHKQSCSVGASRSLIHDAVSALLVILIPRKLRIVEVQPPWPLGWKRFECRPTRIQSLRFSMAEALDRRFKL